MSENTVGESVVATVSPLKRLVRAVGLVAMYNWLRRDRRTKLQAELDFQREWVREFCANKDLVLEYWRRHRYFDEIVRTTGLSDSSKVLDVGCGISTVLHFVPGRRFGIDPLADEYVRIYDYPRDITIKKSQGERIPFAESFFDVVFCTNVLDHVVEPHAVLAEVRRVLKPDGHFVLTVEVFPEPVPRSPCHPFSFTGQAVLDLVTEAGFEGTFSRTSPWFGLRNYVKGIRKANGEEIIMILRKR